MSKEHITIFPALFFAVFILPFIGGIKGFWVYFFWVFFPAVLVLLLRRWDYTGMDFSNCTKNKAIKICIICVLTGTSASVIFLFLNHLFPSFLTNFILVLPIIHSSFTGGNNLLFILLIPVAHIIHELFFRGFVQSYFKRLLKLDIIAVTISTILFLWTHVFVFMNIKNQIPLYPVNFINVMIFVLVESVVAGFIFARVRNIAGPVLFRMTNLIIITIFIFTQKGLI